MKKVISLFLSVLILIGLCSCSQSTGGSSSDDIWYDSERTVLDFGVADNIDEVSVEFLDYDKDADTYSAVMSVVYSMSDADYESENFSYSDYYTKLYREFASDGTVADEFDLKDIIGFEKKDLTIHATCSDGEALYSLSSYYSEDEGRRCFALDEIDTAGKQLNSEVLLLTDNIEMSDEYAELKVLDDGFFAAFSQWDANSVLMFDSGGNAGICDLSQIFGDGYVYADTVFDRKEKNLDFLGYSAAEGNGTVEVGGRSLTVSCREIPKANILSFAVTEDGGVYGMTSSEILAYDEVGGDFETVLDGFNANFNLYEFQTGEIVSADEDGIVVADLRSLESAKAVYRFKPMEENPNAEKTQLTVAVLDYPMVDRYLGDALYTFNLTSAEAHAVVQYYDYTQYESMVDKDVSAARLEEEAKKLIAEDLMTAIGAGEGPDVVIGAFDFIQLNNDKYFVDQNGGDIDTGECFESILQMSQQDGVLYSVPLSFTELSLITSFDPQISIDEGFTFEEYSDFVRDECNGYDAINDLYGRKDYFELLFTAMHSDFYSDGKWDFTGENFAALCEYIYNIPENSYGEEYTSGEVPGCNCVEIYGFVNYCTLLSNGKASHVYGLPSFDGHGPTAKILNSVSVTTCCKNNQAATDFVNLLLSTDMQVLTENAFPVNSAAFTQTAEEITAETNATLESNPYEHLTGVPANAAEEFSLLLENNSGIYRVDPTVLNIVYEEVQAYFADQRTLDEVISNIQNRVNTYTNENG